MRAAPLNSAAIASAALTLSAIASVAHGVMTVYNPRPFVLSVGSGACFATMYSPQYAVTTDACASLVQSGASVGSGSAAVVAHAVPLEGPLAALRIDPPMGTFAQLGVANPFVSGELVSQSNGEDVNTPVTKGLADRGPLAFSISPSRGCPRTDGGPVFSDTRRFGSNTWMEVPIVAVVDASASSCVTLAAIPVAPYMTELSRLLNITVDEFPPPREDDDRSGPIGDVLMLCVALGFLAACITPACLYFVHDAARKGDERRVSISGS